MRLAIVFIAVVVMTTMLPQHEIRAAFEPLIRKSCAPNIGISQVPSDPCNWDDLIGTIRGVISAIMFPLAPTLALLFVLIGGFMMMFGGPFPDKVNAGKTMITTALVGYILVLISGFVVDLVLDVFRIQPYVPPAVEQQPGAFQ